MNAGKTAGAMGEGRGKMIKEKWAKAKRQARAIGLSKTEAGRRKAVLTWCQRVKEALR